MVFEPSSVHLNSRDVKCSLIKRKKDMLGFYYASRLTIAVANDVNSKVNFTPTS